MGCSSSTCWGDFSGWVVCDKALSVWQAQSIQPISTKENTCNDIFRFVMFMGQFPPALFTIQSITTAAIFPPSSIKEFQNISLAPAKTSGSIFHGKRITNRCRRKPERGRGARVTGLRPYGEARHPHRVRRSEPGKPSKSERAFTASCGRNSGSSSPAGRRIWSGNRQSGGLEICCFKPPFGVRFRLGRVNSQPPSNGFYMPFPLAAENVMCIFIY